MGKFLDTAAKNGSGTHEFRRRDADGCDRDGRAPERAAKDRELRFFSSSWPLFFFV